MKKIYSISVLIIALLTALKCEDDKSTKMVKAKIVFSGMIAADGCGWLLEIEKEEYSPVNLEENFQKDGMKVEVEVSYLKTGFQCGMNPNYKIPQIKIISMKHLTE